MHELSAFLSSKQIRSTFELEGRTFEIELETPDLSGCESSVWGDWGPMYTFDLESNDEVRVTYRCAAVGSESEYELRLATIELNSPMSFATRQKRPFFLRLADRARGLAFSAYLDPVGCPAELEVTAVRPAAEVAAALLERSPSETRAEIVRGEYRAPVALDQILESQLGGLA